MSAENVEIVRKIYRAWEDGSPLDSGLIAEDIEWVNAPEAVEPGTRHGPEAFERAAESVGSAFEDVRVEFERFLEAGDRVVVIGVLQGRMGGGPEISHRQGYVWTIRDGKAVRFQWFNEPADALDAAGLSDADV